MNSDDLIAEIVMKWEEAFDHGTDLAADELCVDHPELVEVVARRIVALKEMSWVKDAGAGYAFGEVTSSTVRRAGVDFQAGGHWDLVCWRCFQTSGRNGVTSAGCVASWSRTSRK